MTHAVHWTNLTIAFLLELCALGALAWWGVHAGSGAFGKAALGIGAPLVAAVAWGLFAAPRATYPNPVAAVMTKVLVFGAATVGLAAVDHPRLALVFVAAVVINAALMRL